jgi:transcriptional regulator with XRE-family HTH domain
VTCTASLDKPATRGGDRVLLPGVVTSAVLQAARLSAGLTQARLAIAASLPLKTIQEWEEGSSQLAAVPFPEVERLQAVLRKAGADPRVVADFNAAAWCDLVILAMSNDEDTTCLMADPISREAAFGELLLWSLAGHIPLRYRPYTTMLHQPSHFPRATG